MSAALASETPAPLGRYRDRTLLWAALPAAILVAWQAVITAADVPAFVMPGPLAVGQALVTHAAKIAAALLWTLRTGVVGLVVAFALALALAAAFSQLPTLGRAFLPLVIGLRTAPVLAIAPILIMTFGRGIGTGIAVVVIVAFFPIMVNAMRGFAGTPKNALELMHVCGAGPLQTFLKLRLPAAMPFIFTGLRAACSGAFLSAMLAEWLSGAPGLGTVILESAAYRELGTLWAAVLVSMAAAFLIFVLTSSIERRVTAWRL